LAVDRNEGKQQQGPGGGRGEETEWWSG
jgi:hypothetical protein